MKGVKGIEPLLRRSLAALGMTKHPLHSSPFTFHAFHRFTLFTPSLFTAFPISLSLSRAAPA